ncbi:hypothetical protein ZHAS_00018617 [Anopheles sinensis]|uniref:Uncharacterized protein n=1 Tax=Anopheles sinensis TaxID=74873 RepID=A0A084WJF2_ANOSI|nr:hypothetical protein ZHAS_00018617 [Anopheles sinensis]
MFTCGPISSAPRNSQATPTSKISGSPDDARANKERDPGSALENGVELIVPEGGNGRTALSTIQHVACCFTERADGFGFSVPA